MPQRLSIIIDQLSVLAAPSIGHVVAELVRTTEPEVSTATLASVSTPFSAAVGCDFFAAALPVPHTIDNHDNHYAIRVTLGGGSVGGQRFGAVRVYDRL